jgi:transcriptional repressor NrdR
MLPMGWVSCPGIWGAAETNDEGDGRTVRCPFCRFPDSRVIDSREVDDGAAIRRRRSCPECSRRFTTVEEAVLAVVKRSGVTEPFSRAKVMVGVRRACQGRPVDEDALALLSQQVEEVIRAKGSAEVSSHEVGLAILGPLRKLDEVAYLRFASVYRSYESVDDFATEILRLRAERGAADSDDRELSVESGAAAPNNEGRAPTSDEAALF